MTTAVIGIRQKSDLPPLRDDCLYTADEAALYTGMSANWLKRAAAADRIQHTYVGRFPRWSAQHIRDIVAGTSHRPHRRERMTRKRAA
ncbi:MULTISPECIES: hypothetical protein [Streptomyces]|uniref:Helix-turn-helix domain protein n=1 Tax=Streptomyces fradiae ATCC 10745 = DSM 40063 TaxID=1319510 RepID=A0A1Y2NSJ2_STRFR|nr:MULTISPECIES: hypothetical protein [Streptomyces]KAF0647119.1 hypothetical protein K701_25350 [Streptomyces fradiae ATCC 10745 = DSM 40063]OSY50455.1 hypothetical protein BG846_03933 [Streptomyces fradiae ATCC 10745 = DSM 40063]